MNATTEKSVPQTLAKAIGNLMNSEAMPAPESAEFQRLMTCIKWFVSNGTAREREELGCRVVSLLIEAGRSHVQTTQVLRDFGSRA